ncbi:PREDICTED: zinc finger protein 276 [Nanorana parkeri]|uniref:zinc finger protein 276 n=1 Tax=Nanorana parkeri TaxID=125878 RepID=UPI0008542A42|nr:PREDICTED: zinc finger protein 276 [Nanorana parkeri]
MKRDRRGRSTACHRRASRGAAKEDDGGGKLPPEVEEPGAGIGKPLGTGYCRLCHGKFSSRSLRQAFGKVPVTACTSEKQKRMDQVFFSDFQQLVGVSVRQDPWLPQFVCKDCHAQFYKCRSVLKTFIQRVNTSPTTQHSHMTSKPQNPNAVTTGPCADLITSSPECLHSLVNWTHSHAGGCSSVPSLQQVFSAQYCGIIRAVWGCEEGHDYIMEADSDSITSDSHDEQVPKMPSGNGMHTVGTGAGSVHTGYSPSDMMEIAVPLPEAARADNLPSQNRSPALPLEIPAPPCPEPDSMQEALDGGASPQTSNELAKEGSELSDGESRSKEDGEERGDLLSSDDSFEPYPEKRIAPRKSRHREARKTREPRERKKPGPKPGWKKTIKREREELPTIYKCPYQGCTAVYRGADGMKKHIKEHHEEVRERPCPHPGCNKVFMIDRYLQRHVKLIHTEERNYICDQCGQAFKQRKHLSVHQMRHSGAKPLQCEVCGFQCRQRASLKYHMTKHKAEADLEFACDQCGKRFEKAHNLNVHMSMVHPLTQSPAKPQETEPDTPSGTMEAVKPELAQQMPS